ncbi:GTPase domain-containing protein [Microcoleus sp. FACHB-SPT15]|uniref:GTPase domain-containing protein n=1 Tax=Microcoleus sp. FACHB-SPT15 TaxID=2692830 RepID=UPI001786BECB|nr:GTPase domain-containing protein [Microcoleus sp. FACHB-SPT15]MBD1805337.1 GTPase domain-containing protein [Microcoleus sp. FACHB-SPT15]
MNTYTVILVGPRSSGKTVFLASMYKRLSTPGVNFKFYLEADESSVSDGNKTIHQELVDRYNNLADPKQPWEPGTIDIEKWNFTCKIQKPNFQTYEACRFTYVDFAGGDLTQRRNEELEQEIKKASCILVLLDGQKILYLMRNQDEGNEIFRDLGKILPVVNKNEDLKNPIHCVISKWDLLEKAEISLEKVRDKLLEDESFYNFVYNRIEGNSSVRLIPVSAVGKEFAELQPDGSMNKMGKPLKPFLIEAPLACILPDKVQAVLTQKIEENKNLFEQNNQSIDDSTKIGFWDSVLDLFGGGVELFRKVIAADLPPEFRFTDSLLKKISEAAKAGAQQTREQEAQRIAELERQREVSLKAVQDEHSALNYAIESFLEIQARLDKAFPASMITIKDLPERLTDEDSWNH